MGFCRDSLCPQPEGGAEGVVRPGPSLKGLFPLVRNPANSCPMSASALAAVSPPHPRDLSVGQAPRGSGRCLGRCFLSGPWPQKHFVSPSPPRGPAPQPGSGRKSALNGTSVVGQLSIRGCRHLHLAATPARVRQREGREDAFSGACEWAQGPPRSCCLASGDALQAPVAGGGGAVGAARSGPPRPPARSAGSPIAHPKALGSFSPGGFQGQQSDARSSACGVRAPGRLLALTSPLCVCLGWYRGYTLRKKSKKVSRSSH